MTEQKPICIIYFSRTGHSEKIAKDLSEKLPCDMIKISEQFSRSSAAAYWYSFNEHYFGKDNSSYLNKEPFENLSQYKAFIFIGPIWWWGLNAPVKNACDEVAKKITQDQHVFLGLSFAGKYNPGDKGSYEDFVKIFKDKAIIHHDYLGCQENWYAEGKYKDKVLAFENEILEACGLPKLIEESKETKEEK